MKKLLRTACALILLASAPSMLFGMFGMSPQQQLEAINNEEKQCDQFITAAENPSYLNTSASAFQKTIGWGIDLSTLGAIGALTYFTQKIGLQERVTFGVLRHLAANFVLFPLREYLCNLTGADSFLERNECFWRAMWLTKYGVALKRDLESPKTEWFGSRGYDLGSMMLRMVHPDIKMSYTKFYKSMIPKARQNMLNMYPELKGIQENQQQANQNPNNGTSNALTDKEQQELRQKPHPTL